MGRIDTRGFSPFDPKYNQNRKKRYIENMHIRCHRPNHYEYLNLNKAV